MYAVVVYDVNTERVSKVCKLLRRYLLHVQNSVFEGETTPRNMNRIHAELAKLLVVEEDSVLIYQFRDRAAVQRETMGLEKRPISNIL